MTSKNNEIVVLKNGSLIRGEVLVKQFVLAIQSQTLKLQKADILEIHYKNPPVTITDEVKLSAGTRLDGELSPAIIPVRLENTPQVLRFPKTDIHSIVLFTGRGKVSAATRKMLASIA